MPINLNPLELLKGVNVDESRLNTRYSPNDSKSIKQKRYRKLMRGINIYSYSTFSSLHACERKLALSKLELSRTNAEGIEFARLEDNVDFAFGRAIESGVQSSLLNKSTLDIWWDMFNAWDVPLFMEHPNLNRGIEKSFTDSVIAIDKFQFVRKYILEGWEVAFFNGRPAIELSFCIDFGNGYYYVGHTDIVLFHPMLNRYKVLEIKTTGRKYVHEAMYKNSDQAIGYSIVLDSIAKDNNSTATFDVDYLVFMTSGEKWKHFPFAKSRSQRADWINAILLDIQRINVHRDVEVWPKRGGSCMDFGRPCQFFDICDMSFQHFNGSGEFDIIGEEEMQEHEFDFRFTLQDIIDTQMELV